ncbi:MAG: cation transporter [Firmicutes bacterium]|nr:cation transporter [Bacillota bacterium]
MADKEKEKTAEALGGDPVKATAARNKVIVKTSITGIAVNVLLAAFKAAAGIISHSIAVVLDAVNNLSDALSSVITIIGTRLAGKRPDKKHPLGYGRIEYLTAMLVAAIVLYAGITSLVESIKKIIDPQTPEYTTVSLIIIAVAVPVKILLGSFVKRQGKKVNSAALEASGADALFDAILSASVLICALIFIFFKLSLEAYVGVVIALFIIRAGFEMMRDTLSDILGRRADVEVTKEIKSIIKDEPEVMGAYDLILNNYGPDRNYGSVHLELRDTMTVEELDRLTRRVEESVYRKTGVILTGIGVYSYNTGDDEAAQMRNKVREIVLPHDFALQSHGFYVDTEAKKMRLDVVFSFDADVKESLAILYGELQAAYPDYDISITPDVDVSD